MNVTCKYKYKIINVTEKKHKIEIYIKLTTCKLMNYKFYDSYNTESCLTWCIKQVTFGISLNPHNNPVI